MNNQSELYTLLHHLKRCPSEFLDIHDAYSNKRITTKALVFDLYRMVKGNFTAGNNELSSVPELTSFSENHIVSIQIGCWLLSHERFRQRPTLLTAVHHFLFHALTEVAPYVNYKQWIEDDDRAEEFIRLALLTSNIVLDKETTTEAADRFDSLSTIKRQKVLAESNAAVQRMKEIRQRMEEQKAREAANVYGKE